MRYLSQAKFNEILERHQQWLVKGPTVGRKAVIENKRLKGLTVIYPTLEGVEIRNCELIDCAFPYVCFRQAKFVGSKIFQCDFRLSELTGANLQNVKIIDSDFSTSLMPFANLSDTKVRKSSFVGTSLANAESELVAFENVDLTKANFVRAVMPYSMFSQCSLRGADLMGSNLEKSLFSEVDLRDTILASSNLKFTKFKEIKTSTETNFLGAFLSGSNIDPFALTKFLESPTSTEKDVEQEIEKVIVETKERYKEALEKRQESTVNLDRFRLI